MKEKHEIYNVAELVSEDDTFSSTSHMNSTYYIVWWCIHQNVLSKKKKQKSKQVSWLTEAQSVR